MGKNLSRLVVTAALAMLALLMPSIGHTDSNKYCAVTSLNGGSTNCGFQTFAQCMEQVRGMGGSCQVNQFYTGPEKGEAPAKRKRKTN